MRVAIAAGASGGHVIPALTVLDALLERSPSAEAAFFGPDDRGERELLGNRDLPFYRVKAAGLRGRNPISMVRAGFRITAGVVSAFKALRRYRPNVVFSTGGYGSFPSCIAAKLLRLPIVIFLPDVEPGWAVRAERRLATRIATTTEDALEHLPKRKTTVTGYPVRAEFFSRTRAEARATLNIPEDEAAIVVAGASQGAQAINRALIRSLPEIASAAHVLHITGRDGIGGAERARESLPEVLKSRYQPAAFREDLPQLMIAADLAVLRGGASILGELPAASLPAILIPGTYAGGHQRDNALWLVDHGAAELLEESAIGEFSPRVLSLLANAERLRQMTRSSAELAMPSAAADIGALIEEAVK